MTAPQLLDVPTVQAQLGGVSRTTVFELLRTGRLRSVKIGRRRMIPDSEVARYIAERLEGRAGRS